MHYFVRVNGETTHNNPSEPEWYVPGEPPKYPKTEFDYSRYCLRNGIVRIGWPDVGDLREGQKKGALANGYDLDSVETHVQKYLAAFKQISPGEVVLTTEKETTGLIYIGTVTAPYSYFHELPKHPYECAHRVGVQWDSDSRGNPIKYWARDLSITTRGGLWLRAFQVIENSSRAPEILPAIDKARSKHRDSR